MKQIKITEEQFNRNLKDRYVPTFEGRTHSEEGKAKISQSMRLYHHNNKLNEEKAKLANNYETLDLQLIKGYIDSDLKTLKDDILAYIQQILINLNYKDLPKGGRPTPQEFRERTAKSIEDMTKSIG